MIRDVGISKRDNVIKQATRLFREKGYASASMRDLAKKLGIEAASLYSHIKSKEEILQQICFEKADAFNEKLNELDNVEDDYEKKLEQFLIGHIEVLLSDTDSSAVFLNEWKHLSEPFYSKLNRMKDEYESKLVEIYRQGINEGKFIDLNEKLSVLTMLSSVNWVITWYKPTGSLNPHELSKALAHRIIHGIMTK
ncbi:TetR/AcrR family transcriptional regulator [Marinigracilibium pacificum]|uniref:TetR/AcrR family transcriptional regulator n=1 Tax=Marinigracilibium pacificum TaxID=2729599 RepID=A0A848J4R5_9BACT|nr:TetR/AcrR family transcriptional regulator [Marinigracilibium pacificum]NMM50278.1 TetR/AcrR family transcriptional regulator [Marinigracilibium pacificum]